MATAPATARSGSVSLRLTLIAVLAAAVGVLAYRYGTLEDARPAVKLGGAIGLSVGGFVLATMVHPMRVGPLRLRGLASMTRTVTTVVAPILGFLSIGAALIHFSVIQEHLDEYWLYGVFFIVVAIAQLAWGLLVALRPSRPLYVLGALGNLLVAAAWVMTRTVGALVGPDASETAEFGTGDVLSTGFQILIGILAISLLSRRWAHPARPACRGGKPRFHRGGRCHRHDHLGPLLGPGGKALRPPSWLICSSRAKGGWAARPPGRLRPSSATLGAPVVRRSKNLHISDHSGAYTPAERP
jgi:hypothetical protein